MQPHLGNRLKYHRQLNGMTQEQMAGALNVTKQHLGRVERGSSYPSLELVEKACRLLDLAPASLFLFETDPGTNCPLSVNVPGATATSLVSGHAVWFIDPRTGKNTWSTALARLLGCSPSQRPSLKAFLTHVHAKDQKAFAAFYKSVRRGGRPQRCLQCRIMRKGEERLIHVFAGLQPDGTSGKGLACLTIMDVTEWQAFQHQLLSTRKQLEGIVHERTKALAQAVERAQHELELRTAAQEEACRKSDHLERLFTAIPAILYSFVPGVGGTALYSRHVRKILGYSREDLAEDPMLWNNSIHPEDKPRVDEAIQQGLRGSTISLEYRIRTKSGQWRWLHDQARLTHDEQGHSFFSGVALDISERKGIEDELAKTREALLAHSEQRYRRSNEIVFRYDLEPNRGFAYVSPSVATITGYTPEEHYADPDLGRKIVHPEDRALLAGIIQNDAWERQTVAIRWIKKDGQVVWTEQVIVSVRDDQGRRVALEGFVRDVTAAKQAEEEQRILLARYRALFENSSEGVFLHDLDGNILDANQAILDMFGYDLDEIRAMHPTRLVHPDDVQDVQARFQDILELKTTTAEHRCLRKYGSEFIALIRGKVVHDRLIQGILRDVTRERQQAKELMQAKQAAEAATRSKSEFLANLSHELRTPLNGIIGMMHLLRTTPLDAEQSEYIAPAIASSDRLVRLLDDLIDMARIEADMMEIHPEAFNVRELRSFVLDLFTLTARQKNILLSCSVDPSMPMMLSGDIKRVRQILFNLVGNALKFIESGSVRLDMVYLPPGASTPSRVLFSVSDTGMGMPDEIVQRMFLPFVQADGSGARKFQGAGLGLAIVKRLVDLMSGNISIESCPGKGTTIHVVLPFQTPAS